MKRRPGETKAQALDRIKREKEKQRIEKLLRMAFPRQRETYVYKKMLLPPEAQSMSVDLFKLKQESIRREKERNEIERSLMMNSHSRDMEDSQMVVYSTN